VSLDHTRPCISTSKINMKNIARINSTVKVIQACIFIGWPVLEGTQRAPPTCIITYLVKFLADTFSRRPPSGIPHQKGGLQKFQHLVSRTLKKASI
jgi:hypothetical protein